MKDSDRDIRYAGRIVIGRNPVNRYISRLLLGMIRDRTLCRTLKASEQLPPLGMEPSAMPSFAETANRLKIMCDLEPREYSEPVDGRIAVEARGEDVQFWVHFCDGGPEASFDVTLASGA